MPYYEFGPNDIFHNRIKAHPKVEFVIYANKVYYNNNAMISGSLPSRASMLHMLIQALLAYMS